MPNVYAFLTESLDDEHELAVLKGVIAAARDEHDVVLCLPGRTIGSGDPERRARNFIFDLVPDDAKGILVLSGSIANDVSSEVLHEWLKRFKGRSICSMGVAVPGCSSVEVDNERGVSAAVDHLISQHSARNIAFIGGPSLGAEAAARLAAFHASIERAGLQVDEGLIFEGDYTQQGGECAIRALLRNRHGGTAALDAVVAANDYMAIGAMEELSRWGVHVPNQVKVVGFDDMESARATQPRLTTVRQPAIQQGREGFGMLRDGAVASQLKLPTELVIRQSCGCDDQALRLASQAGMGTDRGVQVSLVQRRQIILAELMRAARGSFGSAGAGWESRLLDALIADLRDAKTNALSRELAQILSRMTRAPHNTLLLQELLTALYTSCLPSVWGDPSARDRIEASVHDARTLAAVLGAQSEKHHALGAYRTFVRISRRLGRAMFKGASELARTVAEELPALGIAAALVVSIEQDSLHGNALFGFSPNGRFATGEQVSLKKLHQHPAFERVPGTLVALPLVHQCQALGVAFLRTDGVDGVLYEELADVLTTVLLVTTKRT